MRWLFSYQDPIKVNEDQSTTFSLHSGFALIFTANILLQYVFWLNRKHFLFPFHHSSTNQSYQHSQESTIVLPFHNDIQSYHFWIRQLFHHFQQTNCGHNCFIIFNKTVVSSSTNKQIDQSYHHVSTKRSFHHSSTKEFSHPLQQNN